MKHILLTLIFLQQTAAFAMSRSEAATIIKTQSEKLGALAYGLEIETAKGRNAQEILLNFVAKNEGDRPENIRLVTKEIQQISYSDEVDTGFTSAKSATAMSEYVIGNLQQFIDDPGVEKNDPQVRQAKAKLKVIQAQWAPAILALKGTGAEFAYDGHGPGYCGVSFVRLLIVDPNTQRIYIVSLSEPGEC